MRLSLQIAMLTIGAFGTTCCNWHSASAAALNQSAVPDGAYTHPQQLIPVDGTRQINLFCIGTGEPTVLLDAGSGGTTLDWRHVQGQIATFTRVCSYDRAGMGFSDAASRPSDVRNTVDDLHRLLSAAQIPIPIIYVGHSIAGLYGIYFEATYPQDVAGAVFVDPAFPNVFDEFVDALPITARPKYYALFAEIVANQRACLALARKGALVKPETAEARGCVDSSSYPDKLDPTLQHELASQFASPQANSAMLSAEEEAFPTSAQITTYDAQMATVHPDFGNKPLIVLTQGDGEPLPALTPAQQKIMTAEWKAGHDALAQTSTRGVNIVVPNTGHFIQIDQPAAVINAVRQVVIDVRKTS